MAFDRNNTTQLQALYDERINDPLAIGYSPNDNTFISQINDRDNNPGGQTGVPPLTAKDLWNIVAADSATATQFEFNISNLFSLVDGLETDISEFRAGVVGLGDSQISAAINALTRDLSRSEFLFGGNDANGSAEFVNLTVDDWFAARDFAS